MDTEAILENNDTDVVMASGGDDANDSSAAEDGIEDGKPY